MTDLAVITPSYRPDVELFTDLHRSVLECTPDDTIHHVIVPAADRALFERFASRRCHVWTSRQLLPARYLGVPRANMHLNVRRPWPPVRGWIMQQAVKLAAAATVDADVVLLADSDVVLVRPVRVERFAIGGRPSLYREDKGVTADMERHVIWHRVARELLGLPAAPPPPLPDYVSPLNFWRPETVRALQRRIEETTGRNWLDAFNGQLHISEFILYGVFVDGVLSASGPPPPAETTLCHTSWARAPLNRAAALEFADALGPDALAMMISAKSHTPVDVRRAAIVRCAEIVRAQQ